MNWYRIFSAWNYQLVAFELINEYLTSSVAIFIILIDIVVSIERCFIINNKKYFFKHISYKIIILLMGCIALCFYSSMLISSEEKKVHKIKQLIQQVSWFIRIFLASILLTIINSMTALGLRKRLNKKLKLQNSKNLKKQQSFRLKSLSEIQQKENNTQHIQYIQHHLTNRSISSKNGISKVRRNNTLMILTI
jgi:hypothetical protein